MNDDNDKDGKRVSDKITVRLHANGAGKTLIKKVRMIRVSEVCEFTDLPATGEDGRYCSTQLLKTVFMVIQLLG